MRLKIHPPLVIAGGSGPNGDTHLASLVHAHLWMKVDLAEWGVVRQGHLHLVRATANSGDWKMVDLAGHPVRLWRGQCPEVRLDSVESELAAWLVRSALSFYRVSKLAVVSELGEGIDDFRRRVLAGVGRELRSRLEETESAPSSQLPWQRRPEEPERARSRRQLAFGVAGLGQDIEQLTVEDPVATIVHGEAGLLLVGAGIHLPSPASRDLMIG